MTTIIVGGGIVGLSLAYGLLEQGKKVIVLDGADDDFRASRGNFGLIWVQGKGFKCPPYANWSRRAALLWPDFAADLQKQTGIDLALSQKGGISYFTSETALSTQVSNLEGLRDKLESDYPFDVLDHAALKKLEPKIGPKVIGGTYSAMDGHVNPLFLLRALSIAVRQMGGVVQTGARVIDIKAANRDFTAILDNGEQISGEAVVLAAGLGTIALGERLGFKTLIRPQQGQVLITEKLPSFMTYPSGTLRQVNEGGVQIGASEAEIGHDDREDIATIASLARHAVDVFPHLERVKLVRSWAALRIMSPDGLPIYQRSPNFQGASFVTCHSGITLSSAHARLLPDWLAGNDTAVDLTPFSERRFDVQPT